MTDDDERIVRLLADEMVQALATKGLMELVLRPQSAFHLAGLVQLALRHPGLNESSRHMGVTVIEHVRGYFADAPTVLAVLRRGDDPREDR
jgi:hypothetical protein